MNAVPACGILHCPHKYHASTLFPWMVVFVVWSGVSTTHLSFFLCRLSPDVSDDAVLFTM